MDATNVSGSKRRLRGCLEGVCTLLLKLRVKCSLPPFFPASPSYRSSFTFSPTTGDEEKQPLWLRHPPPDLTSPSLQPCSSGCSTGPFRRAAFGGVAQERGFFAKTTRRAWKRPPPLLAHLPLELRKVPWRSRGVSLFEKSRPPILARRPFGLVKHLVFGVSVFCPTF